MRWEWLGVGQKSVRERVRGEVVCKRVCMRICVCVCTCVGEIFFNAGGRSQ